MTTPILLLRQKRRELVLILATAVFLASAVNFASSYASILFSAHPLGLFLLALVCLLAGAFLFRYIVFGHTEHVIHLSAAIAYRVIDDVPAPIRIIGYSFNDDFGRFLRAFIHENKAYSKLLSKGSSHPIVMDRFDPDDLNHHTIINSVVEFTLLHHLHLHLNSYFIRNELDTSRIVRLTRSELGAKVLKNRVIEQLTRDMEERPVFSDDADPETKGIVVAQYSGGAIYERLELELPPKSSITRNDAGYTVIKNPVFELTLMPKYQGLATLLPHVLTPSEDHLFSPRLVSVKLLIRVRPKALLTRESMEMYGWLDSLVEELPDYISTDRLTRRIDPDLVEVLAATRRDATGS